MRTRRRVAVPSSRERPRETWRDRVGHGGVRDRVVGAIGVDRDLPDGEPVAVSRVIGAANGEPLK